MNRFLLIALVLFCSCEKIRHLRGKSTPIDPCDPISNYYDGDTHYIERDFVSDDRNIDQNRLLEAQRVQNSPCDPLHKKSEPVSKPDF